MKKIKKNLTFYVRCYFKVRLTEHKLKFAERKKMIQNKFRSEMGLLVDVVLQGKIYTYS